MAHSDITAIFLATEDRPMAPLFGSNIVVQGKRILISALGANFDRVDVLQTLRELITDQNQLVVWKSSTLEPLSLDIMTFEEIEIATQFKATNEASTILGDSLIEYNNLKAQYLSANNDQEQAGVLSAIKSLCFNATLENLASNALKGFGSFQHEPSGVRVFLLDNRKLYTFDQARVRNIANNIAKENAKAAQLSGQDERKMPSQKPKSSKKKSKKVVKSKSGSECEEEPELLRYSSSSSVSIPCEGAHTDSEEELQQEGISTPVITGEAATKSSGIPAFNIGDAFSVQGAKSDSRAQDKSKQKRHRKKERKQRVSKPKPSKQFKKSSKKDKKSRTKKHKKHFSRHRSSSSSSSDSVDSSSSNNSSSGNNSSSDQVF